MIPVKIVVSGDIQLGKQFIGEALSQMRILDKAMSFQGLNEDSRTVKLSKWVTVQCWTSYSFKVVHIHAVSGYKLSEYICKKSEKLKCFSFACFSVGRIIKESLDQEGIPIDMHSVDRCYDVEICDKSIEYILILNCKTSDFATYQAGEKVIVSTKWDGTGCRTNAQEPFLVTPMNIIITPLLCSFPLWENFDGRACFEGTT